MVKQAGQDSVSISPLATVLKKNMDTFSATTATLPFGVQSLCGAWQKAYSLSKLLYIHLIFKSLVSETWLSEAIIYTDYEILPQDYTIYMQDRGTRAVVLCWQSVVIYLVDRFQVQQT